MKRITIFTPTYNRAYTIGKLYESLKIQTNQDFKWLIIDDGSTDNTKQIVEEWKKENIIEIEYVYKKNGGMHSAHNFAYDIIDTELNTCIDSDDYLVEDAIEKILTTWENVKDNKNIAGIIALDASSDNKIIGTKMPENIENSTLFDLYQKYKVLGDKKVIYRTSLTKDYSYPIYEGEKYVPLSYKYNKIDEEYTMKLLNEIICIVEYMPDGATKNARFEYLRSAKGNAFFYKEQAKLKMANFLYKLRMTSHYVVCSRITRDKNIIKNGPGYLITILSFPIGFVFSILLEVKYKKILKELRKNRK